MAARLFSKLDAVAALLPPLLPVWRRYSQDPVSRGANELFVGPSGYWALQGISVIAPSTPSWAATSPNSAVMVAETTLDIPARSIVAPNLPSGGS
jgi:hypothetical protein